MLSNLTQITQRWDSDPVHLPCSMPYHLHADGKSLGDKGSPGERTAG